MDGYFKVDFAVLVGMLLSYTIQLQAYFHLQSKGVSLYNKSRSKILGDTVGLQFRHLFYLLQVLTNLQ